MVMCVQVLKREFFDLTDEGKKYAAEGSPEFHFFSAVPEEGTISMDDLQVRLQFMLLPICFSFSV